MDRNLIDYLPQVLKEYRDIKAIMQAEQSELSVLWDCLSDVLSDQFALYATANGISRWENILAINPKGTDTLELRRFRILARLGEQRPYTAISLRQQMAALCGEGGYSLTVLNENYMIKVRVELAAKGKYNEVEGLLKRTIPANMIIDLSLMYNQYLKLIGVTYGHLSSYTFEQLRNEVIA